MSESKVAKELQKHFESEENVTISEGRRQTKEVFLVRDSKGSYILRQINSQYQVKIRIIYKSGGVIDNEYLRRSVFQQARGSVAPIFIIWLGSCEFTKKENISLVINEESSSNVDLVISKYENFKREILAINSRATIVFIECPPISCIRWNECRGVPGKCAENTDNKLSEVISYFNVKLNLINNPHNAPRFYQDLVQTSKRKNRSTKYKINYKLLTDGVHPSQNLTKLWLLKIYKLARVYCYE